MNRPNRSGFILPLALVLATGVLLLAVLAWQMEMRSLPREEAALLNERARTTLFVNLPGLVESLEEHILLSGLASALVPTADGQTDVFRPVALSPASGESHALYSTDPHGLPQPIYFRSPLSDATLMADQLPLDLPGTPVSVSLAWAAEDLNLMAPQSPPPEFWPLPSWDLAPSRETESIEEILDSLTDGSWQSLEWIPAGQPLPMSPEISPALVPVVRSLGLRFGIFAAGSARNPEKTIRVRFFIEGELWNPYNRDLAFHPGSGLRSVLRVIFWNLPEIRLHNRTVGLSSGWIPLDRARNSHSGSSGLHGFVRLPGKLGPGDSRTFIEPDPARQAQGLARTLLTGFTVRPADRIDIEFRQPAGGLYAACLPMDGADPLDSALEGQGWFRAEAFPADWPGLSFGRADSGPRPFLLEDGSLSFRLENTHIRAVFTNRAAAPPFTRDPRRARIGFHEPLQLASGEWSTGGDLASLSTERIATPVPPQPAAPRLALLSWPQQRPRSLVEAMDIPQWNEGFRLGSADAAAINQLLDNPDLPLMATAAEAPVRLESATGEIIEYRRSFPVNQIAEDAWWQRLTDSGAVVEADNLRFPAQVHPDPTVPHDFRTWSSETLQAAVRNWTESIRMAPLKSPADFFNSGLLGSEIPPVPEGDPLHLLMPLRGWLSNTTPPRPHGAAWILHLAIRASRDSQTQWASARLWLLEARSPQAAPRFEPIRFEWTEPPSIRPLTP
jgi:hypothetical protein